MPEVTAVDTMPTYNCRAGARTLPVAMGPNLAALLAPAPLHQRRVVCLAEETTETAIGSGQARTSRLGGARHGT